MARQFLTGLNLNKNELINAKIQNLSTPPSNPTPGLIYFDTDTNQLTVWDGTAWVSLAAGGNVSDAIQSAIDALDTDDIEEGSSNLYYTTSRAKSDAAALLTGATKTNIIITGDGNGLTITAENGVADSTTDDLEEGTTNLYFTNQRAIDAVGGSATSLNTPNTVVKRDVNGDFAAGEISVSGGVNIGDVGYVSDEGTTLAIDATTGNDLSLTGDTGVTIGSANGDIVLNADGNVYKGSATSTNEIITQGRLDSYIGDNTVNGSTGNTIADRINAVDSDLSTHINDTSAHGVDGNVVGTSDSQTLTNKTLGTGTVLSASVDADGYTITDLGTPTNSSDAATKGYVDTGISTHASDTSTHGVGEIVGTTEAQTLTNKTLGSGNALSAALDADGFTIANLPTPTNSSDAATKGYVDNAVAGLTWKPAVHLLATSNVALTGDSETLVIDGHAALSTSHVGYRILLTAQTTDTQNGIYVYADTGTAYTLTRAADADVYTELGGATVFVQEGTTYGQSAWTQGNTYLTSFADQEWVQFSGAAQIVAGAGLTKDGNTLDVVGTADRITANADSIDIASTYVGQSSITTLGTITTGVWNGTDIAVADGGTGSSTAAGARANLGATTKYTEANPELTVSSGEVTWTVTHNLGIRTVVVQVFDTVNFDQVEVDVERTNTSTVTLQWPASATVDAGAYQVVIVG